jgi:hypothetical protein
MNCPRESAQGIWRGLVLASLFCFACFQETSRASAAEVARSNNRPAASMNSILFLNGDLLYGALQSIDPQNGILWRHPDALQPIEFSTDSISEIQFGPRPESNPAYTNTCIVYLTNQDQLEGKLVSCDAEKLTLETWYAGKINIPRSMVRLLTIIPSNLLTVFEGPTGLAGWTMGKVVSAGGEGGYWKYKNGAFYASQPASIARDLKLPDSASIEFDLAWKGNLYLAIALYTDYMQPVNLANKETEPDFGGFYSLQINSFYANLLPVTKSDPLRYLGQISVPAFNRKRSAHVDIRINKSKRLIALLVDGALVKQWVDTEAFVGQGTGIRLVHQGLGVLKLNQLKVTEWDGQFEEPPDNDQNNPQDLARLRNGDRLVGNVESIRDDKLVITTLPRNSSTISLERVKQIEFAGQKAVRPEHAPSDVLAFFNHGGRVQFRLEKWGEQGVEASSPTFGKVRFNPAAFSRIEFKPLIEPQR